MWRVFDSSQRRRGGVSCEEGMVLLVLEEGKRLRARKADDGGVDADAGESDEGILCDAMRVPD